MAPYLKTEAADMRLRGRRTVGSGCWTVDELSEKTRQGHGCCCQEQCDLILGPLMHLRCMWFQTSHLKICQKTTPQRDFFFFYLTYCLITHATLNSLQLSSNAKIQGPIYAFG